MCAMTGSMEQEGLNTPLENWMCSATKIQFKWGKGSLSFLHCTLRSPGSLKQLWDGAPASSQLLSLQQNALHFFRKHADFRAFPQFLHLVLQKGHSH